MTLSVDTILYWSWLMSKWVWGIGGMVLIRKTSSHRNICLDATSRDVDVELVPVIWGLGLSNCVRDLYYGLCLITPCFRIYCSCSDWLIYHVGCYLFQHHSLTQVHLEVLWVTLMLHHLQPCRKMSLLAGWGAGHFSELKWLSSLHLNKVLSPILLQWAALR
jgi:hypothetical protein